MLVVCPSSSLRPHCRPAPTRLPPNDKAHPPAPFKDPIPTTAPHIALHLLHPPSPIPHPPTLRSASIESPTHPNNSSPLSPQLPLGKPSPYSPRPAYLTTANPSPLIRPSFPPSHFSYTPLSQTLPHHAFQSRVITLHLDPASSLASPHPLPLPALFPGPSTRNPSVFRHNRPVHFPLTTVSQPLC